MVQQLESDVRGHIKLEHEMKIHMDYLENKLENLNSREKDYLDAIDTLKNQLEISQDKINMIKDARA